jgi:hypothetical protein
MTSSGALCGGCPGGPMMYPTLKISSTPFQADGTSITYLPPLGSTPS